MKKKVYSFNSELYKVTGVQKVMMDVHHAVQDEYEAKIVGTIPFERIHADHRIGEEEYIRFSSPFQFHGSIVILHERKFLLLFWLLNHLFFQKIKLVYIHHNTLVGHKLLSIFPKHVIAISDSGIKNLTEYFHVPASHITKIYNCVRDIHPQLHPYKGTLPVKLLLPARINEQKQQIEIVRNLKERLSENVRICFAGIGPQSEELKRIIGMDKRFEYLGYRSDIYNLLHQTDYMLLFSRYEGLPITLIEADMMGTPVVCNSVGGNEEIVRDGVNGFVVDDWTSLVDCLNQLPQLTEKQYRSMSLAGRNLYKQNFTFESFRENYLSLLSTL